MRENAHFEYFKNEVLPYWKSVAKQNDLRVWSAGCSSGEEPYTLAMIMADYFGSGKALWDTKVLATDISVQVLSMAEKGIYSAEAMQAIPEHWKVNHFKKIDEQNYQISNQLKQEVVFRIFNLMDDAFPFKKKFHVIFCRNVMIYFDDVTKRQLVKKFYDMMEPGGYLFIGHSESIARDETSYKYVKPAVYRKG